MASFTCILAPVCFRTVRTYVYTFAEFDKGARTYAQHIRTYAHLSPICHAILQHALLLHTQEWDSVAADGSPISSMVAVGCYDAALAVCRENGNPLGFDQIIDLRGNPNDSKGKPRVETPPGISGSSLQIAVYAHTHTRLEVDTFRVYIYIYI